MGIRGAVIILLIVLAVALGSGMALGMALAGLQGTRELEAKLVIRPELEGGE